MSADPTLDEVSAWVESLVGAEVTSIRRQPRWRPVWFLETVDGAEYCVRGERIDADHGFSLRHEMTFQRLLQDAGVPVASVRGWSDDLRAYAMDVVPGANDFVGTSDEERRAAMDHYIDLLAAVHALDVKPFADAGIIRAADPADAGRVGMATYEAAYRRQKRRPDPLLEFCLGWIRRHPVDSQGREAPIVWDSGQFHHSGGRITAILDLEIAHIGDPMMDLAGFRMRDSIIGYGEFDRFYERYEQATGQPVDLAAIRHHHLCFTLTNRLAFHPALAEPGPGSDYMTNLHWCSETDLYAIEALAETLGITLATVEAIETGDPSPTSVAMEQLVDTLGSVDIGDEYARHQVRTAFRMARYVQRFDQVGPATVAADLDDIGALTGSTPQDWQAGDAALEAFILGDDGTHDEALIQLFHRRLTRHKATLGPPGSAIATHLPIPGFGPA